MEYGDNGKPEVQLGPSALQIEDNRDWPALHGLSSSPSTNTREP